MDIVARILEIMAGRATRSTKMVRFYLPSIFIAFSCAGQSAAQGPPSLLWSAPPREVTIVPSNGSTGAEQPPPKLFESEIKRWRMSQGGLNQRDIERLARDVGYRGARLQNKEPDLPWDPELQLLLPGGVGRVLGDELAARTSEAVTGRPQIGYQGQRNMDVVTIKGDAYFRQQLTANGLEYLDHIDNRETGMQAMLIKDKEGDGRVYVIFRGTEPTDEPVKDLVRADLLQWVKGQLAVGKNQYDDDADKAKLDQWAKNHSGNITVTAHSLGAALGQRFIADHPEAIKEAAFFNAPGVECDLANRVPREKLPPINYYLHPRDPVSNLGGCQHLYGKVTLVDGAETDSYIPLYGRYVAHSAWMLQSEETNKQPVDYDKHQAARDSYVALTQETDKEARDFAQRVESQIIPVRAQIAAAQGRGQNAAGAAVNAVNAARALLAELRAHAIKAQAGQNACSAAFGKRREIDQNAAKVVKFAEGAAKGMKAAGAKVVACASKEEVRAGLVTYDAARKLAREALSERRKLLESRSAMEAALEQAQSARAARDMARRAMDQIAAQVDSAQSFARQAREEAGQLVKLADALQTQKNILLARADAIAATPVILLDVSMPGGPDVRAMMLKGKIQPSIDSINADPPSPVAPWAEQAEDAAKQAEDILTQARGALDRLANLNDSLCDMVDSPDEAVGRAEAVADMLGSADLDAGLLQKANLCLAKLSPPDALQTTAPVNAAPPPSKDLLEKAKDQIERDRIAQERERLEREARLRETERIAREEAERQRIAAERRERELARQRAEQEAHVARQREEQSAYSQPNNPMDSLLSGLVQGLQKQQQSQQPAQRQPQRMAPPQVARSTPDTRAPARSPAAASSGPKYFALVFSAMKTTALAYQKVPECRFMKHDGPYPMSQAKPGEIDKALAELRGAGSTSVDVKYFYSEQDAERFKTEWGRRVGVDSDRCLDAQYRVLQQTNPLYRQKGR